MLLFLLSLGGIPFVAGFWAAVGLYGLVLLGAVLTVVALFYYLMVAKRMYIDPPRTEAPLPVPASLAATVFIGALAVVLLGVYPKPLVGAALAVSGSLF